MNRAIFKAYDIRGRYPDEINEAAGRQIAEVLADRFQQGKIIIGYDARLSSPSIYEAIREVFQDRGFIIEEAGLCTTPMFYFLANELKAVGGVMVTASHAPKEFNGLKVVKKGAEIISGTEILDLLTKAAE